jgi:hypothetical protein
MIDLSANVNCYKKYSGRSMPLQNSTRVVRMRAPKTGPVNTEEANLEQATSKNAPQARGDTTEEAEVWVEEVAESSEEAVPRVERAVARHGVRMEARRRVELYMEERRLRTCLADEF